KAPVALAKVAASKPDATIAWRANFMKGAIAKTQHSAKSFSRPKMVRAAYKVDAMSRAMLHVMRKAVIIMAMAFPAMSCAALHLKNKARAVARTVATKPPKPNAPTVHGMLGKPALPRASVLPKRSPAAMPA